MSTLGAYHLVRRQLLVHVHAAATYHRSFAGSGDRERAPSCGPAIACYIVYGMQPLVPVC
jgi:hypothetical protein